MSLEVFDWIGEIFKAVCQYTGLKYSELNVLVYCIAIPFSWVFIMILRQGLTIFNVMVSITILTGGGMYIYKRALMSERTVSFYECNIKYLNIMASNLNLSYVIISLIIGVIFPCFIWMTISLINRRFLTAAVVSAMILLACYQFIVILNC